MSDTKDLRKFIKKAGNDFSKKATAQLRSEAYTSGWPVELSRHLTVKHMEDGKFTVKYPDFLEEQILDQELGTQNTAANPVLRTFMNRFSNNSNNYDALLADLINDWNVF